MPEDLIPELICKLDAGTTEARNLEQDYDVVDIIIEPKAKKEEAQKYLSVTSSLFVDRKKELKKFVNEFLFRAEFVVWNIHTKGKGGIGKTQFLLRLQEHCRTVYGSQVIICRNLIDFYHTENRSRFGIIQQIVNELKYAADFTLLEGKLEKYQSTKDSSERQVLLGQIEKEFAKAFKVVAARAEEEGKPVVLLFDTYEVIQHIQKENAEPEPTKFSHWFENTLLPYIQPNTKIVIAGRYKMNSIGKNSVPIEPQELGLFKADDATEFLIECQKIAWFYQKEYEIFLDQFHGITKILNPVQYSLPNGQVGIPLYELTEQNLQQLGEEVCRVLEETAGEQNKKELLAELDVTNVELQKILQLAGGRPIYLALFMDWVRSNPEHQTPSELLAAIEQWTDELDEQKKLFRKAIIEQVEHQYLKRIFILPMVVAYRRMTPEIMQYLTHYPLVYCRDMLHERFKPLSFIKYKKRKKSCCCTTRCTI